MDDPTGQDGGYTPAQFAFMLLRAEPVDNSMVAATSANNAAYILAAAVRDYCPRHASDLPSGWNAATLYAPPQPTSVIGALTLATAMGKTIKEASNTAPDFGNTVQSWAETVETVNELVRAGQRAAAVNFLKDNGNYSELTAGALTDSIAAGIIAVPAKVQTAMNAATG